MAILAIDQGTSGTKAVVIDEAGGAPLGSAALPLRPRHLPGGGVEQDPQALLSSVLESGRRACMQAGVPIDAVALANQGETVMAWDPSSGRPLSAAVVWQDRRSAQICHDRAASADLVAHRTGLSLDPYFSAPKMAWLRENVTSDGVVTTTDTWLVHQLCGAFVTDAATASRSLLVDLDTGAWDAELVELFGLGAERLAYIVGSDEVVGTTTSFGTRATPVTGLVVDQQAALFAQSCLDPGTAKCTLGTGAFLLANTGAAPVRSSARLAASIAWRLRGQDTHCLDGQVYTAASAIHWLQDLGLINTPEDLDHLSAQDAAGVTCVPAFAGLGAPFWQPEATASFTGLTLATRREHLVLAVLEGLATQIAELVDSAAQDLGQRLTRLRVDGGLTGSRRLMQILADIAQVRVEVYPTSDATPLGAAAMARMALDPALTAHEAIGPWKPSAVFDPAWGQDQAESFRAGWVRALTATTAAQGEL